MDIVGGGEEEDEEEEIVERMDCLAASPLETERQARIRCVMFRRARCLAQSRPRPLLAPVMIMVLPEKEVVGTGQWPKAWPLRALKADIL